MFCSVSAGVRAASQGDNLPLRSFAISGASTQGPRSELGAPWPLRPPLPAHSCSGRQPPGRPCLSALFSNTFSPLLLLLAVMGGGRDSPRLLPCSLLPAPWQGGADGEQVRRPPAARSFLLAQGRSGSEGRRLMRQGPPTPGRVFLSSFEHGFSNYDSRGKINPVPVM